MHPYLCASIPILWVERNYMECVGDPQECTWRNEILVLHRHSFPGIFKNLGVSYPKLREEACYSYVRNCIIDAIDNSTGSIHFRPGDKCRASANAYEQ